MSYLNAFPELSTPGWYLRQTRRQGSPYFNAIKYFSKYNRYYRTGGLVGYRRRRRYFSRGRRSRVLHLH